MLNFVCVLLHIPYIIKFKRLQALMGAIEIIIHWLGATALMQLIDQNETCIFFNISLKETCIMFKSNVSCNTTVIRIKQELSHELQYNCNQNKARAFTYFINYCQIITTISQKCVNLLKFEFTPLVKMEILI